MEGHTLISWNFANWVTITLMALLGLTAVYLVGQGLHAFGRFRPVGGAGSGAPVTDPATGTSNLS